ncbi:unnamed protein product, partial [Iphiclides podalirius]
MEQLANDQAVHRGFTVVASATNGTSDKGEFTTGRTMTLGFEGRRARHVMPRTMTLRQWSTHGTKWPPRRQLIARAAVAALVRIALSFGANN